MVFKSFVLQHLGSINDFGEGACDEAEVSEDKLLFIEDQGQLQWGWILNGGISQCVPKCPGDSQNRNLQTVFREFLDKGLKMGVFRVALQGIVSNHPFQITINSPQNIRKP